MKVELLAYTPDADKIVAAAAKLCYAKSDIDTLLDGLTPEKTENFPHASDAPDVDEPFDSHLFDYGASRRRWFYQPTARYGFPYYRHKGCGYFRYGI